MNETTFCLVKRWREPAGLESSICRTSTQSFRRKKLVASSKKRYALSRNRNYLRQYQPKVHVTSTPYDPVLNAILARSASSSWPNGVRNGDFELRVAAIVSAGSRQRKTVAMSKNFPMWTSVGRTLSRRPRGVISSSGVSARTWANRS